MGMYAAATATLVILVGAKYDKGCYPGGFPRVEGTFKGDMPGLVHLLDQDDKDAIYASVSVEDEFFSPTKDGAFIQLKKTMLRQDGAEEIQYDLCGWKSTRELICVASDAGITSSNSPTEVDNHCVVKKMHSFAWKSQVNDAMLQAMVAAGPMHRVDAESYGDANRHHGNRHRSYVTDIYRDADRHHGTRHDADRHGNRESYGDDHGYGNNRASY